MKVLGELCQCRLCRKSGSKGPQGFWHPCGCPIGNESEDPHLHSVDGIMVEGVVYPLDRVISTGGRRALWIFLEEDEFVEWLSARRVGERINGAEEVGRFEASVHGCWKVVGRQELVILRRKKK